MPQLLLKFAVFTVLARSSKKQKSGAYSRLWLAFWAFLD